MQPFILPLQIPVFSPICLKFSQVKCLILSFYCTVLFTGCSAKKALSNIFHRKRLRIDQETLQISVFASMLLSLVKKTVYCPMCRVLYEREFEPPTSQDMSKEKSRDIANVGIQCYVTKFSQRYFILSVRKYCTEHFEQPPSLSTSKKNQETLQISIFGLVILNLVKKCCFILPFYCIVLYRGYLKETQDIFLHRTCLKIQYTYYNYRYSILCS